MPNASARPGADARRRFAAPLADTAWTAIVADGDSGAPSVLATDGRNVYVSDLTVSNAIALDAHTGVRRWETRRSPDSAVAAFAPRIVLPRRGGGLIGVDGRDGGVYTLDAEGRLERRLTFRTPSRVESVCELADGRMVVSLETSNAGLLVATRAGVISAVHPLPWPDLRTKSGLLAAVRLGPTRDGCVAALTLGRGFTRFDGREFTPPIEYVERVALPEVRREEHGTGDTITISTYLADHVGAAHDVATTPSAIVTSFGGNGDDRNHLVDVYRLDGAYVESYRTRRAVSAVAATDSMLYLLTHRAGQPIVVALRWRPGTATSSR